MSKKVNLLKEKLNEGLELYIFISQRDYKDRFEHKLVPHVNIQGVCESIRENHYNKTIDLNWMYAHGAEKDESFIYNLATSLELDKYNSFMQYATELKQCNNIRTALLDNAVLGVKKMYNGKYYTSIIDLDKNATVVSTWDRKNGYQEQKLYSRSLPYVRQGCASGDTIEEALVKTALIYNMEKNMEQIENFKSSLEKIEEDQREAE